MPGLVCTATAPATAVERNGTLYVCIADHISGDAFDGSFWREIAGVTGAGYALDVLTVSATNTVSTLSTAYSGVFAIVFVNGQGYPSNAPTPAFSISGTTLTWLSSDVTLNPGVTEVAVLYSTASVSSFSVAAFISFMGASAGSLPTTKPGTPGLAWLNDGVLSISKNGPDALAKLQAKVDFIFASLASQLGAP